MVMDLRTWLEAIACVIVGVGTALYVSEKVRRTWWWINKTETQQHDVLFAVVVVPTAILLAILLLQGRG